MTRSIRAFILLGLVASLAVLSFDSVRAQAPQAAAPAAPQATPPQTPPPPPPPPINQSSDPLLKSFKWRSIGPASMGGRIDDIAVVESNPSTY